MLNTTRDCFAKLATGLRLAPCILLVFLFAYELKAEKVTEIKVVGNINIKTKTIIKQLKTRKGKEYFPENIRIDITNILSMENIPFEDVKVDVDTTTYIITYIVKERPLVKKIEFKGNKKVSRGKLKAEIDTKKKEYLDTSQLNRDKQKIIDLYDEKGYVDTKVEYDIMLDELLNQSKLIFFITGGRKVIVKDMKIWGLKKYKPKKILKLMKTRKKKIYREKQLKEDLAEMRGFYKNKGFESVEISTPQISYNEQKTLAFISLNINEGSRYRWAKIDFSGNTVYTSKQLSKMLTIKPKRLYTEKKLKESQQAITDLYADKGYLRLEIAPELTKYPERGQLDINFIITENNIVYVDRVYIDGNNYTKEFVIHREILLKENEPFSAKKLRRSMEKIYNLGFLDDVRVDFQDTGSIDKTDLLFTILEGKPGMLSAGAGYSSIDKLVGTLQVSHMNLFGRAQRLNLSWEFGERRQNYDISWTEPWFLHKPVSLGFTVFNLERVRDYGSIKYAAYRERRRGGDIRIGPRLSEYLSLFFTYSYELVDVYDSKIPELVKESRALTSSFASQIINDTRDNIFDPSRGSRNSLSVELAGGPFGGDIHFYKPMVRSSWYLRTFWKFVLSANINFGFVDALSGHIVPLYEKYYTGGADTVRGYVSRELGPEEGGSVMLVTNIEYKFPIVRERKRTILQGAFFYDIGADWKSFNDVNLKVGATDKWAEQEQCEWDNLLKSGFGFGIRFTTPVFPIRLDWGYALQCPRGKDPLQFYFTIGQIF